MTLVTVVVNVLPGCRVLVLVPGAAEYGVLLMTVVELGVGVGFEAELVLTVLITVELEIEIGFEAELVLMVLLLVVLFL